MSRPRLSIIDSWANHETRVLKVLMLALEILRCEETDLTKENEDDLNYKLYFCMLDAVRELGGADSGIDSPPAYECINQPLEDEKRLDIARKRRPDFQWGYIDHLAPPRKSAKFYYIECKRLGTPVRSDWPFNQNYISNGVLRFVNRAYNYGRASSSGTMIGYVQSMENDTILAEVNTEAGNNGIPVIHLDSEGWKKQGVSRLDHELDRPEVSPTPFKLRHLWLDLRH